MGRSAFPRRYDIDIDFDVAKNEFAMWVMEYQEKKDLTDVQMVDILVSALRDYTSGFRSAERDEILKERGEKPLR